MIRHKSHKLHDCRWYFDSTKQRRNISADLESLVIWTLIWRPHQITRLDSPLRIRTKCLLPQPSTLLLVRLSDAVQEHSSESSHLTLLYTKDSSGRIPWAVALEILEAFKVAENSIISSTGKLTGTWPEPPNQWNVGPFICGKSFPWPSYDIMTNPREMY